MSSGVCDFFDEKSTVHLIEAPLYKTSHFSLADFGIPPLALNNLITMCLGVTLFEFSFRVST